MKYVMIAAAITLAACNSGTTSQTNSDTMQTATATGSADSGWVSLFDGQSLNGWHTYGMDKPGSAWNIDSNAIHLSAASNKGYQTEGGGDLVTNEEFEDFDLKLEWKISDNGNSGIIFYVQEDTSKYKETWRTGLEMQVLDNDGHSDGKIEKHRAGNLYDLIASNKDAGDTKGKWHQAEIISNDGKLDFYFDGEHTVSTTLWNDEWKQMVAKSKFNDMPGWGTFKKGHIALQDHGNDVWYRNIMIKRL